MVMTGQSAKDLRGFKNLAGLTGQNHCGKEVVPYINDSDSGGMPHPGAHASGVSLRYHQS